MKTLPAASAIALALVAAALVPATSASAADSTVTGVVTLDGAPIGGVEVGWYDPATRESGETVAAADGSYSLTIAGTHAYVLYAGINREDGSWKSVGGDSYVGVFEGAGKTDYLFQGLPLITGVPASGAIDLDKPGSISGVAPGTKSISIYTGGHDLRGGVKPDAATGAFSVTGLIPGTYFAEATPTDKTKDLFSSGPISVAAGAATAFAPDFGVRSTGTITGVVKSGGKAVTGIRVAASSSTFADADLTDSKGHYSISKLPAGKYDLTFAVPLEGKRPGAYRSEMTSATVAIAKKTTVNESLVKGGTVSGTVVRGSNSGYFRVIVLDSKQRIVGGASFLFDKKAVATKFSVKGVKRGHDRTVMVVNDKSTVYAAKTADVDSSVSMGSVSLTSKTFTLRGTVKGATTGIVSYGFGKFGGAFVGYLASGSASIKNGKYTLRGVLPGTAVLSTNVKGRANHDVTIHVSKSMTKTLTVGAKYAFPTLAGTFLVDGRPLPLADVSLGKDNRDYGEGGTMHIVNGVGTGSATPGRTWIVHLDTTSDIKEFQTDSPFYLSIPIAINRVKLAPNTAKDFGTVNLTINR